MRLCIAHTWLSVSILLLRQKNLHTSFIMRSGRQVSFAETCLVFVVANLSAGPCKHNLWFTKDEIDLFKENLAIRIIRLRRCVLENHLPPVSYIVGLEKFITSELTEEYVGRRDKLMREVLIEARSKCANYAESSERLKRLSAENRKWAKEQAQLVARFLERYLEIECTGEHQIEPINGPPQESKPHDVSVLFTNVQPGLRSSFRESRVVSSRIQS